MLRYSFATVSLSGRDECSTEIRQPKRRNAVRD